MITVKICRGTVCHVMGGSDLPLLPEVMPNELKGRVTFEGTTCLKHCQNDNGLKPPFVDVNGTIISEATIAKVIKSIQSIIGEE